MTYTYTVLNQMETVTDNAAGTVTYTYDENGRQTEVRYPNGAVTATVFDSLNRPTQVTTKDSAGKVIAETIYTLDAAGHRAVLTEPTGRWITNTTNSIG